MRIFRLRLLVLSVAFGVGVYPSFLILVSSGESRGDGSDVKRPRQLALDKQPKKCTVGAHVAFGVLIDSERY